MVLEQLPNVTLIGETTYGIFSNSYGKRLPNGWDLHLSTERYFSHAGLEYEQQGIAPDIEERPNFNDLNSGQDNILERALQDERARVIDQRRGTCAHKCLAVSARLLRPQLHDP